jgi:hypothetical protein
MLLLMVLLLTIAVPVTFLLQFIRYFTAVQIVLYKVIFKKYGYYNLTDEDPRGCTPCDCNPMGTTSQFCDTSSGQCPCKDKVVGRQCLHVKPWTFDLHTHCPETGSQTVPGMLPCTSHLHGTHPLWKSWYPSAQTSHCHASGTENGDIITPHDLSCDQNTGQCTCLSNRFGRACDDCLQGRIIYTFKPALVTTSIK